MEKNKQAQQKIMELKALEQQINQLQQQMTLLNNQQAEFSSLKNILKNIKNTKKDTEFFSPLGAGIFAKAEIKDTQEVLMNIGSNVHIVKTIDEASKLIDNQIKEMKEAVKQMELSLQGAAIQAQTLQQEIMTLTAKTK